MEAQEPQERLHAMDRLVASTQPALILNTCQRLEYYGMDEPVAGELRVSEQWKDVVAFERLARIAAGLESRLLGELEILGQVRSAYKDFRQRAGEDHTALDRIFQDALALARRARRISGIDRNLVSLSALAARAMLEKVPAGQPVAVVGSGTIAGSAARYLAKRELFPVRVTSRCPQHALDLALSVGGFSAGLDEMAYLLKDVSGVITATAAPHPVVYPHHIENTARPLHIIDLSVPPDCHPDVTHLPHVRYTNLEAIEQLAQASAAERQACAQTAAEIIRNAALERTTTRREAGSNERKNTGK